MRLETGWESVTDTNYLLPNIAQHYITRHWTATIMVTLRSTTLLTAVIVVVRLCG